MPENKMELTLEELEIFQGKKGPTLQKVMRSIVRYGEVFGAKRLVPISGPVHLVTSFGITILKPVFDMMDELIAGGFKTLKPFTVNPRPMDFSKIRCNLPQKLVFKIMYGKQQLYEEQLRKVGIKNDDAYSCTCYMKEVGNTPKKGDMLAWAESSAVVYANSVLGARSNRNSGIIELLCGILGKAPDFGLLTDEGRKASFVIEIKTTKLPEAQLLGSAIGIRVVEEVPYIKGLDKFLGEGINQKTSDYLKDMGAAGASNGAVGLYHVESVTPEAVEIKEGLISKDYKSYIIDDEEIKRIEASYPILWRDKSRKIKRCFIGCPHLSVNQIYEWTDSITSALEKANKTKLAVDTILTAAPGVIKEFEKDQVAYNKLKATGAKLTYICPLMYMNNPLCSSEAIITNSNKLRTYTTARYFKDQEILDIITCGKIKEGEL